MTTNAAAPNAISAGTPIDTQAALSEESQLAICASFMVVRPKWWLRLWVAANCKMVQRRWL